VELRRLVPDLPREPYSGNETIAPKPTDFISRGKSTRNFERLGQFTSFSKCTFVMRSRNHRRRNSMDRPGRAIALSCSTGRLKSFFQDLSLPDWMPMVISACRRLQEEDVFPCGWWSGTCSTKKGRPTSCL